MNTLNESDATPATPMTSGREPGRRRLFAITAALGVTQIIGWGTVFYPPAVVATAMGHDIGAGREAAFWGITVVMLSSALSSAAIGGLIDRLGARRPLAAGCLATALGLLLLSAATGPVLFWLGWVVLGIAAPLSLSTGAYAALARIAGQRARTALSALTLFSGLASTVFYPLTHYLADTFGWRTAYLLFAAMHVVICLPVFGAVVPRSARHAQSRAPVVEPALRGPRARAAFGLFVVLVAANTIVASGLTLHLIHIFNALGLTAGAAVGAAALTGPSQVAGRIVDMLTGNRYPAIATAVFGATLQFIALALLLSGAPVDRVTWVFVVIYGLSNGLMTIARVTVPLTLFGTQRYGATSGRLNVAFSIATAIAPVSFAVALKHCSPTALLAGCMLLSALGGLTAAGLWFIWHSAAREASEATQ